MTEPRNSEWVERLGRAGYAAKGVVYSLVGWFAARAALEVGQRPKGSRGVISTLIDSPLGRVLLAIIAVGLLAYVGWRLVQAFLDPAHPGETDAKRVVKRIGYFISALIYGVLAFAAFRAVVPGGATGGGAAGGARPSRAEEWTAMVMQYPLGRWAVGLVGAGIFLYGIYSLYRAFAVDLSRRLDLTPLGGDTRPWIVRLGRIGVGARGLVFLLMGGFVVAAAVQYDPQEAMGLGGALRTLGRQPYGSLLLAVVAIGLIAYGLYQLAKARYRRVPA